MATKVSQLMKKQPEPKVMSSAVKDLISQSMSKGGKVKAIKLKVKFGSPASSNKPKRKVNRGPASHRDV